MRLRATSDQRVYYCNSGHSPASELGTVDDVEALCPECGTPMQAVGSFSTYKT